MQLLPFRCGSSQEVRGLVMGMICLHTPKFRGDETTTQYDADCIVHVSPVHKEDSKGTTFYIEGVAKEQYCTESANELRRMIEENKTQDSERFSINNLHIGDQVSQQGVMLWWKNATFTFAAGFLLGVASSFLASWLFKLIVG